jgi:hypothetical protein
MWNVYGATGEDVTKKGFYYEPVNEIKNFATTPVSSFSTGMCNGL